MPPMILSQKFDSLALYPSVRTSQQEIFGSESPALAFVGENYKGVEAIQRMQGNTARPRISRQRCDKLK